MRDNRKTLSKAPYLIEIIIASSIGFAVHAATGKVYLLRGITPYVSLTETTIFLGKSAERLLIYMRAMMEVPSEQLIQSYDSHPILQNQYLRTLNEMAITGIVNRIIVILSRNHYVINIEGENDYFKNYLLQFLPQALQRITIQAENFQALNFNIQQYKQLAILLQHLHAEIIRDPKLERDSVLMHIIDDNKLKEWCLDYATNQLKTTFQHHLMETYILEQLTQLPKHYQHELAIYHLRYQYNLKNNVQLIDTSLAQVVIELLNANTNDIAFYNQHGFSFQ